MASSSAQGSTQTNRRNGGGTYVGRYKVGKTLGTGSSSRVKLAKHMDTGEIFAIKIVRKALLDKNPALQVKMRREISVLKLLSHPNLLSLIDVVELQNHLFLITEYVRGCELFEYMIQRGALTSSEALHFFQQIITGLDYCHKRQICHRDLKPENILVDFNLNAKIADFGMTSLARPGQFLTTSCGSPHYCAPQVIAGEQYNGQKADIWSCGVILYALVTGRLPFDDDNMERLLKKIQHGGFPVPHNIPTALKDLIAGMITVDEDLRITLDDIQQHPWFTMKVPKLINEPYEMPTDIITDANEMIVRCLMDLGWGNEQQIRGDLRTAGGNVLKVFYAKLETHPITLRDLLEYGSSVAGLDSTPNSNGTGKATTPSKHKEEDIGEYGDEEQKAVVVAEDGSLRVSHSAPVMMERDGFVRSSSYASRFSGSQGQIGRVSPDAEVGLNLTENGAAPSWFDTMRTYFAEANKGGGNESKKEASTPNDNKLV